MAATVAPAMFTPAEHILEISTDTSTSQQDRISDEQLYVQYEIKRTVDQIRDGRFQRVALQFPDDMLKDAPRVFESLREGLKQKRRDVPVESPAQSEPASNMTSGVERLSLESEIDHTPSKVNATNSKEGILTILGDTSYGACCVDEVAAEHAAADVVVHYGRSCLSPTARLPVIYVFTSKALDLDACVEGFENTYSQADEKVCVMADIPYQHHMPELEDRLHAAGYSDLFFTDIVHDPGSPLPNRNVPAAVKSDPDTLKDYSIFHISTPPTSLLLTLSSRVKRIHIYSNDTTSLHAPLQVSEASSTTALRRRYALILRLSTAATIGVLINTLSVKNYMSALTHVQDLVSRAGKKSYLFVVGKVNPAKLANFAEVDGWVVIGCWESSLIDNADFYRPIVTPFELEVALQGDDSRVWGQEWISDFQTLLAREKTLPQHHEDHDDHTASTDNTERNWDEQSSDDEPPEFDLRTGRYVSHTRPMGRNKPKQQPPSSSLEAGDNKTSTTSAPSALVERAKGDIATINGTVSTGAEFLRSKRTWQGLGSDYEIAYERDEDGKIRGAPMEEGRSGVARGYVVGEEKTRS